MFITCIAEPISFPEPFRWTRVTKVLGTRLLLSTSKLNVSRFCSRLSVSGDRSESSAGRARDERGTSDERGLVEKERLPDSSRRSSHAAFRSVPVDRKPGTGYLGGGRNNPGQFMPIKQMGHQARVQSYSTLNISSFNQEFMNGLCLKRTENTLAIVTYI